MKKTNLAVPLTVLFLLLFFACQQEDDSNFEGTQLVQQQNSITKSVTASEIPNVIQFLESKSNNRLEFLIDDSNSELGMNRSHEDNLSMTTALTDQIEMVTNNYGKSNYSFKLIEEQTKEGTYFLNLVVKEYKDEFYMYIIKYVPETTWLSNYTSELDFASFSGTLYFYNSEGIYVGRSDVSHGTSSTMDTREPCPKDGELIDNNNNNSSTSGGDGASDNGTSPSNTNNASTSTSSSGGVNGGTSGTIAMVCACVGHGELEIMNGTCTCDTIEIIVIAGGSITNDRSMRDLVDCPPEDDCFDAVGDPCANGCDANGDCIEDSEEVENSGVVINADVEIARYNNFYNNLTSEQQTFLDANSTLEFQIQQFFSETGFSVETKEMVSNIIDILIENPNLNFEEAMVYNQLSSIIFPNDSFVINNTINPDEALHFETLEEFEEYKNTFSFDSDIEVIDNQDGTHNTSFKVNYLTCELNINVLQKLQDEAIDQDYEIVDLDTILSGFTLGVSWNQSSYDYTVYNDVAYIDLYGSIDYIFFFQGVGTIWSDYKHYKMRVDIETGQQLLIENGED